MSRRGAAGRGWLDVSEVGSVWGIRFVVALCTLFGRGLARAFLRLLTLYYVLAHATARRASRTYFERLRSASPSADGAATRIGFATIYGHFCRFADVALDRLLIAARRFELFEVTCTGREHLEQLASEQRGAILLGAHLGSFEAMRLGAVTQSYPVNMVVNFSNAQRIRSVLERLDPELNTRFIEVSDDSVALALRIRECVERGELVAILADRVGPLARHQTAQFLGAPARFASGPFMVAAALRCPVYLTFGLYRGANRYDLYCEPFAEAIDLPRKRREQALQEVVQRYAERLEAYVRIAPDNWFNFYDFWGTS
jgi:predicted LPLAT superfamily acyltransferase